ncbi:type III secretion system effector XopAD [Xanthomonas citri pv. glycines]|uniref:type III secretion system effector XopAD n=1 Tax=Xanthomonas citri TaxID=346 RepID=UPI0008A6D7C5|nr:type III secretion system effector XopAD [Xanthomonas citri]AOY61160.1 type III secretion system effector XopAD [Xanthomonas citri pv. glycines str. 8ra]QDR47232.1 type III secretion system effector XopAD [Xanthomonas citri pv. glycines]QDS09214.1 type III secretion system effector XopAD [Xanthomonas citri pv. glycines]QDS22260.1 type III secretion system effector XopAD [Xanthomonas citri pv. glycines]QEQ75536.1 type III secretion system effector XopAD [Xanthomonas citri pv. glycines]
MKTHATHPNAFRTNSPYVHEDKPGLAEDQAAASSSGTQQPLGRPPRKRQRMESDDPGASTRDRQPFTANALKKDEIDASEGAWDRRVRPWQPAAVKNERIRTERYPDRVTADVGASSAHHRPQRSSQQHGVEASASLRPREQPSEWSARKRPREEQAPSRQSKRPFHGMELTTDDLRRAEHQLDSAEKKRLQAQRQQQQRQLSEPHGIARNHNAGLCVSMAYDNELAHRMREGMALPFLEESVNAQVNAQRLDKYLQLIATARRARAGVTPRDLDRCTELAAQYLSGTGWFEGASLAQLAHVGNKLSKHPNQPACMEAIAWIAGQLDQADDLVGLSGYLSVLLLNALAKNIDSGRCERAVARLARHLARDDRAWQSLTALDISLALNTFSKRFDNPDCQATAHRLAARVASDKRLRHAMDAQNVANTLNALSKWPDDAVCGEAASALAERLTDDPGLRKDLKLQEVGSVLNALSKWSDNTDCAAAVSALAERLADESKLRKSLDGQGVANVLNALSKWPHTEVCAKVASALADRLADESRMRHDLLPREVANTLNALSKWPDTPDCKNAANALAARLAAESRLRDGLEAQGVANTLNALSKWLDNTACAAAASALAARLAAESRLRNDLKPKHVGNALNALSKWPDNTLCATAVSALAGRLAADPGLRKDLEHIDVAQALNALSKWPDNASCATAVIALAGRLAAESRLRNGLIAQGVANTLNALSKWPDTPDCKNAANALAARLAAESRLHDDLNAQGVAIALNALCKWPDTRDCKNAANALVARLAVEGKLRKDLRPQEVGSALNALSKWPDNTACAVAASALAERLAADPGLRKDLDPSHATQALNALSKWPDNTDCAAAASALAERLADDPALCKALEPVHVPQALNALCKWPGTPVCAAAASALAARVADDRRLRKGLDAQQVSTALNALSKWPDNEICAAVVSALASRLADEPELRKDLDPQGVATALNAVSKWPHTGVYEAAASALAARVADDPQLCKALEPVHVAQALNALCKWPDNTACAAAVGTLAARLADESRLRNDLKPIHVCNALNALCKWPDDTVCAAAASALAARLAAESSLRDDLNAQGVAIALNALCKWPDITACAAAAGELAARLADESGLRNDLNPIHVCNALNALCKWPDDTVCAAAASALAARLAAESSLRDDLNAQGVAVALNALSKWPNAPACEAAIDLLAARLAENHKLRHLFGGQDVAMALDALSRCLARPVCRSACVLLAERAGSAELPWRQFQMRGIAMLATAMSRLWHLDDEDDGQFRALVVPKLQAMAGHLDVHRERFASALADEIGVLFKALASARLQRQMRPLGRPALERVSALIGDDGLRQTSLEGIGSLCMGLLPLIRSPELSPRHRVQALRVFDTLQPIVARKIDLYLGGDGARASAGIEQHATRCPALTFYQVLKAYAVVSRQWKARHLDGPRKQLRQRRDELVKWVDQTLARTREAIEADLGEMSWNLIAQIEAGDQVFDALDLRMAKDAPTIIQAHPPTRFDLHSGRLSMSSVPGRPVAPAPGRGSTTHVVVDLVGKELSTNRAESDKPYSLFARLTGLPLVEVQLPGELSTFMLARTFNYNGEPWRFDMFGGSRAARSKSGSSSLAMSHRKESASLLPAFRYADTAPGSSLMHLAGKLAPQREDWSRMQRSLLEMVPSDHVVEGTLRLGVFDDVEGPAHPFKPLAVDGTALALCPNDGCGFVKLEVALSIPAFRKHYEAWHAVQANQATEEQRELVAKDKGPSLMPAQALHHYPRDAAALEEAHAAMQEQLKTLQPTGDDPLWMYRPLIGGGYQGQRVRAVPSADDKVHLPQQRSQAFDVAGGPLLLGKPPYDKENLLPVPEQRIATVAQGDATAAFLSQCFGIQYSYTGFDDGSGVDPQMLHSKGMLVVVPEQQWPAAFSDTDLACSKEDLKTLSCWTNGRDRGALPRDILSTGSLRLKDIVEPGRLGALPIDELRKRNMDTDGDDAFIYAGYPKLAALISRVMMDRQARRGRQQSFKPPKTATPAIDPVSGHYQPGRLAEIMSLKRGQRITSAAATLAARFLGQPNELREAMARDMMFGTYDGIERGLRNGLRELLDEQVRDPQVLAALRVQAREAIERAHLPEAREAAELLHAQLLALAAGPSADSAAPALPEALAEAFPGLAKAYESAAGVEARIHAILDNYPVCRLSHAQFPDGQPGLVPGEPELTMRNLFTIAIKVGTDALKSDTGTALFAKIVEGCERSERSFAERVRNVPYSRATARAMQDGRFDPEQTKLLLQRMPSMAAGVMEDALEALQQAGWIDRPQPPAERLRAVQPQDIAVQAQALLGRARQMEPQVTDMLRGIAARHGGQLTGTQHQLKSLSSLKQKLTQRMALKKQTLEEAAAGVNDALRYSVVLEPQDFTAGLRAVLSALDDQGHARVKLTNQFTVYPPVFKAINVTLRSPAGALWEIQFHTPETFALKEHFHDLYKHAHALALGGASRAEQRELQAPALEAFKRVASPPGCEEIDDWQEETVPALASATPTPGSEQTPVNADASQAHRVFNVAAGKQASLTPVLNTLADGLGARLWGNVRYDARQGRIEQVQQAPFQKSVVSIKDKIRRHLRAGMTAEQATQSVGDALRYALELPSEGFVAKVQAAQDALRRQGMTCVKLQNYFTSGDGTYRGINASFTDAEGYVFEVQFHTAESFNAKAQTHLSYKRMQLAQTRLDKERQKPQPDPVRQAKLTQEIAGHRQAMHEMTARVSEPADIERLGERA